MRTLGQESPDSKRRSSNPISVRPNLSKAVSVSPAKGKASAAKALCDGCLFEFRKRSGIAIFGLQSPYRPVLSGAYNEIMTNPDAVDEPVLCSFASQGLQLRYLDWGNHSAPTLLLVHGTRDHARSWDWTAQALRSRWHVVAMDLRGHGDSDWSPDGAYLLPYHILDFVEMVESLGSGQVSIVGHSFGGALAARYAGLYPDRVRKIVFVDSLGPDPSNYAKWDEEGAVSRSLDWIEKRKDPRQTTSRRLATIDEAVARVAKANPRLTQDQAIHLAKYGVRPDQDGYRWKFDPRVSMFAPEDFEIRGSHYWQRITAPTLILHGRLSWTSDPKTDGRAAFFRDPRTITFERSGHWIHHDQLEDFLAVLDVFL
jgi:pimeloyl-ACP methyl ester carboxylesterase